MCSLALRGSSVGGKGESVLSAGGFDGGRRRGNQVFGFIRPPEPVTAAPACSAPQCVRAVAMSRTFVSPLLLLMCGAVCAASAVPSSSLSPFRSANLTSAALLATGKYGKTVMATDEMAVAVQEYTDCAVFRVQARTRGYVALAFVDPGSALAADVLLLWVDDETGTGHILVSYFCFTADHGVGIGPGRGGVIGAIAPPPVLRK